MTTILVTALFIGALMSAMAIGVVLQGKALKGSCGGVGTGCPCTESEKRACAARRREAA